MTTVTLHEFMAKLYQRIQDPERWVGYQVHPLEVKYLPNGELACGCVLQHLQDLGRKHNSDGSGYYLLGTAIKDMFPYEYTDKLVTVGEFNDSHSHSEVLAVAHKAMKLAEGQ